MKNLSFPLIFLFIFNLLSCSHEINRKPQNFNELKDQIPNLLNQINDPSYLTQNNCPDFFIQLTNYLYHLSGKNIAITPEDDLLTFKLINQIHFDILSRYKEFKNPSISCQNAVRRSLRYTRYAADTVIEKNFQTNNLASNSKIFSEINRQTYLHNVSSLEFESGDILLMRGETFVSSMIARVTDEPNGFAHLAIIGKDSSNQLYVLESLIETGVKITPLAKWLDKTKEARIILFRYKDQMVADKAGTSIYNYSSKLIIKNKLIPHDFNMNPSDHSQVFCAELVQIAFELATKNQLILPTNSSTFYNLINQPFMKDIGIRDVKSFAPADIELEPDFNLIAEYRNVEKLRKIKVQDVVMSAIFSWMQNENYSFTFNPKAKTLSNLAWLVRQLGIADTKMQKHMKPETLATVLKFNDLTKILENFLLEYDNSFYKKNNFHLSFKELTQILNNYRLKDCEAYIASKTYDLNGIVEFHHLFRNLKNQCE